MSFLNDGPPRPKVVGMLIMFLEYDIFVSLGHGIIRRYGAPPLSEEPPKNQVKPHRAGSVGVGVRTVNTRHHMSLKNNRVSRRGLIQFLFLCKAGFASDSCPLFPKRNRLQDSRGGPFLFLGSALEALETLLK